MRANHAAFENFADKAQIIMARILIADDDELVAELASQVLIDAGHACGWVTSAEDTLALLVRKRPDVLLLDQDMPGMSGITLLRQLRGSPEFYDLPVIMFTAMTGLDDETQAIYAGAQDYIRKPFDAAGLKSRVARLLAKRGSKPQHTDLKTYLEQSSGMVDPQSRQSNFRLL
ncbi:MAG: response regulator [Pseudomonadota bacterium]